MALPRTVAHIAIKPHARLRDSRYPASRREEELFLQIQVRFNPAWGAGRRSNHANLPNPLIMPKPEKVDGMIWIAKNFQPS
jgi:hypothetical protein